MNKIILTQEQFRELVCEEAIDDFDQEEFSDWEVDNKWQYCEVIVKQFSTGKFFSYPLSRSGSPYSDYYYSYEDGGVELTEVQKVKKVIETEKWEAV
jgi:DNA repair protein SbcC/Rad50